MTAQGVWTQNPDGYPEGSVMYEGPILFPAGIDPNTTHTAVMVLGPAGGVINIPAALQGPAGPSPTFGSVNVTSTAGATPDGSVELVIPANETQGGEYNLNLTIPAGEKGDKGDTGPTATIQTASDVNSDSTPTNNATLIYDGASNAFNFVPTLVHELISGTSDFSAVASSAQAVTSSLVVATVNVEAKDYAYHADPTGSCIVSGTTNTPVTMNAYYGQSSPTGNPPTNKIGGAWWVGGSAFQLGAVMNIINPPKIPAQTPATFYFVVTGNGLVTNSDTWKVSDVTYGVKTIPTLPF